jgi:carboxyl-terminal processing protease
MKITESEAASTSRIKEANLARHLEGDGEREAQTNEDTEKAKDSKADKKALPLAKRDYAVYEALNLLKGLAILQERSS